jgi:hypothetical protein
MGLNDANAYAANPATFRTQVATIWDGVIAQLPSTELVIVGPFFPKGAGYQPASITGMDTDLATMAKARALRYISPVTEGWIRGDGRSIASISTTDGSATITQTSGAFFVAGDVGRAITGPGIPNGATIISRTTTTAVLSAAATATAVRQKLHIRSAAADGNAEFVIGDDGTHPDSDGHKYIAWRLAGHLRVPYIAS